MGWLLGAVVVQVCPQITASTSPGVVSNADSSPDPGLLSQKCCGIPHQHNMLSREIYGSLEFGEPLRASCSQASVMSARGSVGCYLTQVDITPQSSENPAPVPIELYLCLSYLLEDFLFQVLAQA